MSRTLLHSTGDYTCAGCGVHVKRKPTKGQRPRWCPDCRAQGMWYRTTFTCEGCGELTTGTGTKFCSVTCSNRNKPSRPRQSPEPRARMTEEELRELWRSQRSALRAAVEDGDRTAAIAAVRERSDVTATGCWEWQGQVSNARKSPTPYPIIKWSGKTRQVHRMVLEIKHGSPLGSQHAHHTCANTLCVNPDHLQPATHAENVGEMKARRSYEARIIELEDALRILDPAHALLNEIGINRAS